MTSVQFTIMSFGQVTTGPSVDISVMVTSSMSTGQASSPHLTHISYEPGATPVIEAEPILSG